MYYPRQYMIACRDRIPEDARLMMSRHVACNLYSLPEYISCRIPLFFISFRSEVHTHDIIRKRLNAGRTVAVPKSDTQNRRLEVFTIKKWDEDLKPGAYGILEPDPVRTSRLNPGEVDVVIVPGSVFDVYGRRLGYGGGFYDRFLAGEAADAIRIALAFDFQVQDYVKTLPHDEPMDIIVTERRVIRCSALKHKTMR